MLVLTSIKVQIYLGMWGL